MIFNLASWILVLSQRGLTWVLFRIFHAHDSWVSEKVNFHDSFKLSFQHLLLKSLVQVWVALYWVFSLGEGIGYTMDGYHLSYPLLGTDPPICSLSLPFGWLVTEKKIEFALIKSPNLTNFPMPIHLHCSPKVRELEGLWIWKELSSGHVWKALGGRPHGLTGPQ